MDRQCCICKSDKVTFRHDVLTSTGRLTGVTYYFCEDHSNEIDDWIIDQSDNWDDEHGE